MQLPDMTNKAVIHLSKQHTHTDAHTQTHTYTLAAHSYALLYIVIAKN